MAISSQNSNRSQKMKRYNFILSYDIADPKRLRKIAKIMEKKAMRIQFSIYILYDTTQAEIAALLEEIGSIYNQEHDDIRIYRISGYGISMGSAIDLEKPFDFF
jgi:CRISPR-associated protein Cas2